VTRYIPKIPEWPLHDRPRERLVKFGAEQLSDAELLAIVLRVGNMNHTALDLARLLLRQFSGFRGMDSKSIAEMCQIDGIGTAKATQIKAALEIGKRLTLAQIEDRKAVTCSEDVYRLVNPYLRNLDREVFKILLLTSRNAVISEKTVFEGSLTESIVSPREVIKEALNQAAASIVFIHNHPSGQTSPSEEDKRVTRHLKSACELVGINVLDHLIVGHEGYFSFADTGLL
jgi:DNA repair protein RadC